MKLIDGEELMEKVYSIKYLRKKQAKMLIDECTEIEAIPIYWLLKQKGAYRYVAKWERVHELGEEND